MIVGIEVGGTFTDLVLAHPGRGLVVHKVPSTPEDPSEAAAAGLAELLAREGLAGGDVDELLHGSTIAANALIQRRGARTALITSRGFGDVVFNARGNKREIYDPFYRKPTPLVVREHVFEVGERLDPRGGVVTPLDPQEVMRLCDALLAADIGSVAVCLLHSYANPVHEREIARILAERLPQLPVSLSCDVAPEHREYERTSTTVISAYLRPAIERYLDGFERRVARLGVRPAPLIMQSSGGVAPVQAARRLAAGMFLSGPAAAATGAALVGRQCGMPDLITIDVGGTSSDVCLIDGGTPQTTLKGTSECEVDGLPLNVLMTDIVSIGAGGGSVAHVDAGGMLQVGPQSAGARPGPACYAHGGEAFTLSDAMLLLGLLDAEVPLPGGIHLSVERATAAAQPLCMHFALEPLALADRVYRIAVANMARAMRQVSVRRGRDPRDYTLFACGGAGPLIAAALAAEVGMARILVPPNPGVFSAFGLAAADIRMDYVRALGSRPLSAFGATELRAVLDGLERAAAAEFTALGRDASKLRPGFSVDARYAGQGYELRVPLTPAMLAGEDLAAAIELAFHAHHETQYGLSHAGKRVDLVCVRLAATEPRDMPAAERGGAIAPAPQRSRRITLGGEQHSYQVLVRAGLAPGAALAGPAVIVEETTSTLVPAGWGASADAAGNLLLRRN